MLGQPLACGAQRRCGSRKANAGRVWHVHDAGYNVNGDSNLSGWARLRRRWVQRVRRSGLRDGRRSWRLHMLWNNHGFGCSRIRGRGGGEGVVLREA